MLKEKSLVAGSSIRKAEYPVDKIFVDRWSPRAMSGEEVTEDELHSLFEAAKWAPSSYNNQPWRFIYARRNTPQWHVFFNLLNDFNQGWTKNAGALIVIVSSKNFERDGKPSRTHSFDTGAAWAQFALQAFMNGLIAHGMEGFNYDMARNELGVTEDYQVEAMIAVGRPGDKNDLPAPVRQRETPSPRKKVSEIAFEGKFKG